MIKRGNKEEIRAHISMYVQGNKSSLALIKRGLHEEIMTYIEMYMDISMCERLGCDSEVALIERKPTVLT